MTRTHLVVMGVAGSGKSTVARALQERLGWQGAEGDDFHPAANVAKMSSGTPLTDEDRWPWLDSLVAWTSVQDAAGLSTILTCSALRRAYRDRLRRAPGRTFFVHLAGSQELLSRRLGGRADHFMPASLLTSQLATLEDLEADEPGVVIELTDDADVDTLVERAVELLHLEGRSPG